MNQKGGKCEFEGHFFRVSNPEGMRYEKTPSEIFEIRSIAHRAIRGREELIRIFFPSFFGQYYKSWTS
jgi:hypothetical protein